MSLTAKGPIDTWQLVPVLIVLLQTHIASLSMLDIHKVKGSTARTNHLQVHGVLWIGEPAQGAILDAEAVTPQMKGSGDNGKVIATRGRGSWCSGIRNAA